MYLNRKEKTTVTTTTKKTNTTAAQERETQSGGDDARDIRCKEKDLEGLREIVVQDFNGRRTISEKAGTQPWLWKRQVEGLSIEQHWGVQSWQQVHRMNHIYAMQYACMLSNFFRFAQWHSLLTISWCESFPS